MRIAIISDLARFAWAGCEEIWAALASSALQAGHQVAAFLPRREVPQAKVQPLVSAGLELHLPGSSAAFVDRTRNVSWRLGDFIAGLLPSFAGLNRFAPDVIWINTGEPVPEPQFLSGLRKSGALNRPYVAMFHNSYLFTTPPEGAHRDKVVRYYQGARLVLSPADRTRMELEHLLAAKLPHYRTIRNPVNIADLSEIPMPGGAAVRIASIGRMYTVSKGQDILLAALAAPEFRARDWQVSFYGSGPHVEHLRRLARHYDLEPRTAFPGYATDIRKIWADHHILALPSRNESAPLVLVEAMLCGRPSVVTDVGGVAEWVREPDTGFVSSAADIGPYRAALERAWSARSQWGAIGTRASRAALERMDPDPGGTALKILETVMAQGDAAKPAERYAGAVSS